ncbi:hypothetical protein Hanom_Chr02g00132561 [Helianthus anomalus]
MRRSHRERSEHREVHTCATLALRDKEIEELTSLLSKQEQLKAEVDSVKKDWILNGLRRLRPPAGLPKLKKSWKTLRLRGKRRRVSLNH